eukprot:1374034-Amorphochlora_amoeboformis.AAC.1
MMMMMKSKLEDWIQMRRKLKLSSSLRARCNHLVVHSSTATDQRKPVDVGNERFLHPQSTVAVPGDEDEEVQTEFSGSNVWDHMTVAPPTCISDSIRSNTA